MATGTKGYDAVLTLDGTTIGYAQDVELPMTADSHDVTTRSSGEFRERLQGHKSCDGSFDVLWIPTDTGVQAIESAFLNGTELTAIFKDENDYGYTFSIIITGWNVSQALEDALGISVDYESTGTISTVSPSS